MERLIEIHIKNDSNKNVKGKLLDRETFPPFNYGWSNDVKITAYKDSIKIPYRSILIDIPTCKHIKNFIKEIKFIFSNNKFKRINISYEKINKGIITSHLVYLGEEYSFKKPDILFNSDFSIFLTIPPKSALICKLRYSLISQDNNLIMSFSHKKKRLKKMLEHSKWKPKKEKYCFNKPVILNY